MASDLQRGSERLEENFCANDDGNAAAGRASKLDTSNQHSRLNLGFKLRLQLDCDTAAKRARDSPAWECEDILASKS